MYTPETTGSSPPIFFFFLCVFGALDDKISQVSISWELYILKWLTFKMTKNDHSITVEHTWGCEVRLHNSRIGNFFPKKLETIFGKLQIEISSLLESSESTYFDDKYFFVSNYFSCFACTFYPHPRTSINAL